MAVKENSTVRWFTNEMAGAPQLSKEPGTLIEILDACLIDGFGAAAPDGDKITVSNGMATVEFSGGHGFQKHAVIEIDGATPAELNDVWRITGTTATTLTFSCPDIPDGTATGSITVKMATPGYWEKAFADGTTKAAYRSTHPESSGFYLRLDDSEATGGRARIRGYLSMTDIDSGAGAFPDHQAVGETNYKWVRNMYERAGEQSRWAVIADERFVHILLESHYYANAGMAYYHFGDLDYPGGLDSTCFVLCGNETASATYGYESCDATYADRNRANGCYLAVSGDSQTIGARCSRGGGVGTTFLFHSSSNFDPGTLPSPAGMPLTPVFCFEGRSLFRGTLPGMYQAMHYHETVTVAEAIKIEEPTNQSERALLWVSVNNSTQALNYRGVPIDAWGPWR